MGRGARWVAGSAWALGAVLFLGAHAYPLRAQSADTLTQYTGMYRNPGNPDQVHSVYVDGGVLYEESEERARQALTPDPAAADSFRLTTPPAHVVFVRDAAHDVTGLRVVLDRDGQLLDEERRYSHTPTRLNHYREYSREQAMIPMRDGVRLHAVILRPANQDGGEKLPILLNRTPYGVDDSDSDTLNRTKPELAASGYIFAFEDVRGRYGSEGVFVMNRPMTAHSSANDIDETTDSHDTVDWLLQHLNGNNGRVGVYGTSYDGYLATMAGIDAHPAVKAISPQAPMTDVWMGDDFFHNGAFRQSYGFDYVQQMEGQKTDARVESKQDTYEFFLDHANFAGAAAAAHMDKLPTARAFLEQPAYTKFWRDMAIEDKVGEIHVPALEVGGYWDQEDLWGTQAQYAAMKQRDTQHQVFLVLGPWNHGAWEGTGRTLGSEFGQLDFGEATGTEFRKQMEFPFFELYLKNRPGFELKDTASFRTGVNRWEQYAAWPPVEGVKQEQVYLLPEKRLSFTAPTAEGKSAAASYVSDPGDPVPYRHRPIQSTYATGSKWYTWLVEDQRFVSTRKDVAEFRTPVLTDDTTVTGNVTADLFAATTGSDADWIIKLIDEYPEGGQSSGYELMIAEEIFRARYRKSFEEPEPVKPGEVDEYRFSMHAVDHTFLKGHRIVVQVQSTWFPLYDRNPQTFVPNIMTAPKKAYKAETMTIFGSKTYPSRIALPIMSAAAK